MLRFFLVDVIVLLGTCASFINMPVLSQYLYERVAETHNSTMSGQTYCTKNGTANQTEIDQIVANDVSRWTLMINLLNSVPAIFTGVIYTSWGDKYGRRTVMAFPLIGQLLAFLIQAFVIIFKLPIPVLLAYGAMCGLSGTCISLIIQGAAYINDVTDKDKKGVRFSILNAIVGLGGGLTGLASGYWINASGYIAPNLFSVASCVLGVLLLPLLPSASKILKEKTDAIKQDLENRTCNDKSYNQIKPVYGSGENHSESKEFVARGGGSDENASQTEEADSLLDKSNDNKKLAEIFKSLWKVYSTEYSVCEDCFGKQPDLKTIPVNSKCIHGGGIIRGRAWRLWFYLIILSFFTLVIIGTQEFQTMFLLSYPLCFTPVLIGIQQAVRFLAQGISPLFTYLLQRGLKLDGNCIIFIGLLGLLLIPIIMCFAKKPYVVFIAFSFLSLAWVVKPFLQAQMSSLASQSEQGSLFAMISGAEVAIYMVASLGFLSLYPATLYISHWFSWMFTAALCVFPLVLIGTIWVADSRRQKHSDDDILRPLLNS